MRKASGGGERDILQAIRASAGPPGNRAVRIGIGDDCAVLTPRAGEEMVVTTDFSIEGRHFHLDWHPPEAIGHKCLARGLSDIAAMGARPVAAFVSLAVPRALAVPRTLSLPSRTRATQAAPLSKTARLRDSRSWIDRFYTGLLALAEREKVTLAGGDLSESPTLAVADIIAIGATPRDRALLRSTARPGDTLYVTGTLGGAAAELAALHALHGTRVPHPGAARVGLPTSEKAHHPHYYPQPRLATGQALLRRKLASACLDISDGLSTDLLHLCEESDVAAEVDAIALPLARWNGVTVTFEQALHGGDDYELLFTARPGARVPKRLGGVAIHPIGRMVEKRRGVSRMVLVHEPRGKPKRSPLVAQGWQHF